jgi:hypothetical protein
MVDPAAIKVGMLVYNLEGEGLGRVVAREGACFRIEKPGELTRERFVVLDEDVVEVHGGEVRLRQGPGCCMTEREYEARKATSGAVKPRLGEGWTGGRAPEPIPEQSVALGMPVRNVDGSVLGKVQFAGESYFELLCDADKEHYSVDYGDVLNVVRGEVIVRNGEEVLKPRRPLDEEEERPEDLRR